MEIRPIKLRGTYEILLDPRRDDRGYFFRAYDEAIFREHGLTTSWVQENEALSTKKGTVRGLHFQRPPSAETKLVRVAAGAVLDVFVDLRRQSETYGVWDSVELSALNHKMVYIPKGFAHGYCTLSDETLVLYHVDSYYAPDLEMGLRWNDETLNINWPTDHPYMSVKDRALPTLQELASSF